ncbi:signal transduction histidine kinase [Kibdelosporangium banguiense]|uniref:histidine kinase n=1 Tax=Kibdelosporangium banguiense TaxID=1365924 RepID=A0ABS4TQI4_9PSEU|nr:sensor histidine kinase [Kibdelosporangium banguiense]MBP2326671.1 signal transduction histidine kinase [Kibdelosporangium banguiense]
MAIVKMAAQEHSQVEHVTRDDRVRIGQAIHDLIGHKLSVMVLHATALELAGGAAAERAAAIRETGCAAIAGLRDIVESLCDDSAIEPTVFSVRVAIDTLIEASRNAGLPVDYDFDERADGLDADLGEVVFCVVREALTNVHKHAGLVRTRTSVSMSRRRVRVEVVNHPPAAPSVMSIGGSRRGLRGMRKLVERHNGRLAYANTPDGGFRIRAELPVHSTDHVSERGAI